MGSIRVHLDDEVLKRLESRAARNGRSLEEEARHILLEAAGEDMESKGKAFLDLVRPLREGTASGHQTPGWVLIRLDRDSDHGRA